MRKLTEQDIRDDLETLYRLGGACPYIDHVLLSGRQRLIRTLNMILYDKHYYPQPE